jgi:DNA (cytosine-5)-methyltransferase 1
VLAHRWPGVPNLGDITTVDWSEVPAVDILCGGWPCQPFSLAGKRKGIHDDRALWPHVAGAVRLLRPRIVVLENVSAVLTAGEFQRVANDLAESGYQFGWTCARASDVGAPHRRERVFIVAAAQSGSAAVRVDTAGTPGPQAGAHPGDGSGDHRRERSDVELLPTPRTSDTNGAGHHGDGGMDLRTTVSLLCTPSASDGAGGKTSRSGNRIDEPLLGGQAREMATAWGKYEPAIRRWENLTGPAPAPTEPNKNGNPRLSAAFSQWLMGWPDGWVTDPAIGLSRNDQLRIVGNGVCPQQAAAALRYLLTIAEVAA